jgi:hypothetical protein
MGRVWVGIIQYICNKVCRWAAKNPDNGNFSAENPYLLILINNLKKIINRNLKK